MGLYERVQLLPSRCLQSHGVPHRQGYRVKGIYIIKVSPKTGNCLLSSQPNGHLRSIILLVTGSIPLICIVYVQLLWRLSVKSIKRTTRSNGCPIMNHCMYLGYVEMLTDSFCDEQVFVFVEFFKSFFERFNSLRGMYLKM